MAKKKHTRKKRGRPNLKEGRRFRDEERAEIYGEWKAGTSKKQLARDWDTDPKTIRKIIKKKLTYGTVADRPHTGRKPKTSPREARHIYTHLRQNPKTSSRTMAKVTVP
jgi:hypothetical protein